MDTQLATPVSLQQLHHMLELQTRLFLNVNEGLDAHYEERPNEMTNHAAWVAGHLVSSRYAMARVLGLDVNEPHAELFANRKGLDPQAEYPGLQELRDNWSEISGLVLKAFADADEAFLSAKAPFPTPLGDTNAQVLTFFVHHEAYHIGQLGILRRVFREGAMQYK